MKEQKRIMLRKNKKPDFVYGIKNEADFMNVISSEIQKSKLCQNCKSLTVSQNKKAFCDNFEAMWYHRDTHFVSFYNCSFFLKKVNK